MTATDCCRSASLPRAVIAGTVLLALLAVPARSDNPPPGKAPPASEKRRVHWAFQPSRRPVVAQVRETERARTAIDAFLLSRLEAKGISFSPDADRITLARRAYLDLWGVPPRPDEIDTFLADGRADAYEHLLNRLLASPHFGERWGRHWLDVVGYADTVGFDIDANNIILSEGKWKYRDDVIPAFNRDKPYDEFITE